MEDGIYVQTGTMIISMFSIFQFRIVFFPVAGCGRRVAVQFSICADPSICVSFVHIIFKLNQGRCQPSITSAFLPPVLIVCRMEVERTQTHVTYLYNFKFPLFTVDWTSSNRPVLFIFDGEQQQIFISCYSIRGNVSVYLVSAEMFYI